MVLVVERKILVLCNEILGNLPPGKRFVQLDSRRFRWIVPLTLLYEFLLVVFDERISVSFATELPECGLWVLGIVSGEKHKEKAVVRIPNRKL